jgi:2-polyprenyl-3-methyl-5-hydroxy-6-metoxy-1,4-benzoquinol methylase
MEFRKRKTRAAKDTAMSDKYTVIKLTDVTLSTHTATIKKKYIERFGVDKNRYGGYLETDWRRFEYISSLLPEAKSVLDIGIGNGAFLNLLMSLNRFQRILGIDIRRHPKFTMLSESRLYQIVYASVTNLPFADKCIDVVTCMEVLEHLDRQSFTAALPELRRVSRFLLVTVPYNEPESRPSFHKLSFTDSDLMTYFPHGEFILLKKSAVDAWMAIVERS